MSSGQQSASQDVSTTTPDLFNPSRYDLTSSSSLLNTLLRLSEQWSAEQAVNAEIPATVEGQESTVPNMQPLGASVPNIQCRAPTVYSSASRDSATINTLSPGVTTTLMIRNIPLRFTPSTFRELVDAEGYSGRYDYLYMPMDFRSHRSLGYCFINFYEPKWASDFTCKFANRMFPSTNSDKVLAISAATRQGMLANVASFKQSTLRQMPKSEFRPLVGILGELVPLDERVHSLLLSGPTASQQPSVPGLSALLGLSSTG
jgi:hypothetical protein